MAIKGLHHIVLFCADTEASRAWYEKAGFNYLRGYHGMHWVGFGDAEIMLHPAEEGSGDGRKPTIHLAVDDAREELDRVVAAGLAPYDHQNPGHSIDAPVTRPWGDVEFELDDPDGHTWAFTQA